MTLDALTWYLGDKLDLSSLMEEALAMALEARRSDEVPVGAILAEMRGKVIARARNRCVEYKDPTAHAELLVIREGARHKGNYRLTDCLLVCTLEPCLMCYGAIMNARIPVVVFGARDQEGGAWSKAGGISIKGWRPALVIEGIERERCLEVLRGFFEVRR